MSMSRPKSILSPSCDNGQPGGEAFPVRANALAIPDYLGRADLAALGLAPEMTDSLLRTAILTGHDGRPVVPAEELADRIGILEREEG
jgi:hypothetical protein